MTTKLLQVIPDHLMIIKENEQSSDDQNWKFQTVNERFRFCRYGPGQEFTIHQDGVHYRSNRLKSRLTFMIYLNQQFTKGDTIFFSSGPSTTHLPSEIGRVTPRTGDLILFDHCLWHSGEVVDTGEKFVMRSDLIYERIINGDEQTMPEKPFHFHCGYIWKMLRVTNEWVASSGRDTEGSCVNCVTKAHDSAGLCVTSCGSWVATGGADNLIKVWKWNESELEAVCEVKCHTGWVWGVEWLTTEQLVSVSEDGTLCLWNSTTNTSITIDSTSIPLRCLAISHDMLATGDIEGNLHLYKNENGKWIKWKTCRVHDAALRSIRFTTLNNNELLWIVTAGEDFKVRVWNMDFSCVLEGKHDNFVTDSMWLDGKLLSASYDGKILVHTL